MGKVKGKRRSFVVRYKRQRKAKLQKLRQKYRDAKQQSTKKQIAEKIGNIAPHLNIDEYLKQ
ncbi:hypothetical protein IID24_02540 [Patescibacteria group bacterium]|nr:hypothetical protein [Patescibacteria group bacterium]